MVELNRDQKLLDRICLVYSLPQVGHDRKLAKFLGIQYSTVGGWRSGRNRIGRKSMDAIANAIGKDPKQIEGYLKGGDPNLDELLPVESSAGKDWVDKAIIKLPQLSAHDRLRLATNLLPLVAADCEARTPYDSFYELVLHHYDKLADAFPVDLVKSWLAGDRAVLSAKNKRKICALTETKMSALERILEHDNTESIRRSNNSGDSADCAPTVGE